MTKEPKRANKGPKNEDDALWAQVAQSVKPLSASRTARHMDLPSVPAKEDAASESKAERYKSRAATAGNKERQPPVHHELSHGSAPGVDKRTQQKLIKGKMPIEGRLDLHGHTKESAHRALDSFIKGSFSAGKRCVIVITGKGLRLNSGEIGILRQAVPQWLNSPTLRPMVLSFSHATAKDGGEGALYVLLKRKR